VSSATTGALRCFIGLSLALLFDCFFLFVCVTLVWRVSWLCTNRWHESCCCCTRSCAYSCTRVLSGSSLLNAGCCDGYRAWRAASVGLRLLLACGCCCCACLFSLFAVCYLIYVPCAVFVHSDTSIPAIPRALLLILLAFTAFVAATTTVTVSPPGPTPLPASQCGTGNLHCCDSLERSDGSLVGYLLGLLGVVLQGAEVLVGIHCSPIDILGIGQNSCHAQPVCCQNNDFEGLIVIACVPININL